MIFELSFLHFGEIISGGLMIHPDWTQHLNEVMVISIVTSIINR